MEKQIARPNVKFYIDKIFDEFIELSGDRLLGDDKSIISGLAILDGISVTVIGQIRGYNIKQQQQYNFSMTSPEGFRKSLRLMRQAEKFQRPIICFIDTIGACPSKYAEETGQAAAIANNINAMLALKVPIITVLIGSGCSGGALALCVSDRLIALEHSFLAVISPSAYAEILWKDSSRKFDNTKLNVYAHELLKQKIADIVIPEMKNNVYINGFEVAHHLKQCLSQELKLLCKQEILILVKQRQKKYRNIGI